MQWADRGQQIQMGRSDSEAPALFAGASRLGCAQHVGPSFSIWVQVRGSAWVEAKEGKFRLRPGDWVALDRESRPMVQTDRDGLCVGLTLGAVQPTILSLLQHITPAQRMGQARQVQLVGQQLGAGLGQQAVVGVVLGEHVVVQRR